MTALRTRLAIVAALMSAAAALSAPAHAQDQWALCENRGAAHAADVQIAGCTAVIGATAQDLSIAYANRGLTYFDQRDYVRAVADYDEAIRLNPQHADAFNNRAVAYRDQRDYARAIADHDRAVTLQPEDGFYLTGRCWTRAVWGQQLDQALADCDAALRLRSNDSAALDSRGLVNLRRGAFQAALSDYDAAVRADANSASARYGRGMARLRLGQAAPGQADLTAAAARDANIAAEFAAYGLTP